MEKLLQQLLEIRPFIGVFPNTHKWIWSQDEVDALEKVIEAVADCSDINKD